MINEQERYIVTQLRNKIGLKHIPIYRNGELYSVTGINNHEIYENRQLYYSAKIFISDEIVYNLDDIESINNIVVPCYLKTSGLSSITADLSYVLKMAANTEKRAEFIVPMVSKAVNLMIASPIEYSEKDYKLLVVKLWKSGKIVAGDSLDKQIANFNCYHYSKEMIKNNPKLQNDVEFYNMQRKYYHLKKEGKQDLPTSFDKFLTINGFKRMY